MPKSEKDHLLNIIERLARMEERLTLEFEHADEERSAIRKHTATMNDEMGKICERLDTLEALYFKAKAHFEKSSLYWKAAAFVFSPIITFLVLSLIKLLLGLPIP